MWRLPEGVKIRQGGEWVERVEIAFPAQVLFNGKSYPKTIFSDGTAVELGIAKPIRQQGYDSTNYTAAATEVEAATEIVRDWTDIRPKMSVFERQSLFLSQIKATTVVAMRVANEMIRDLYDIDAADALVDEWKAYKTALVVGHVAIGVDVTEILDYDELIVYIKCEVPEGETREPDTKYGWSKHVPEVPGAEK